MFGHDDTTSTNDDSSTAAGSPAAMDMASPAFTPSMPRAAADTPSLATPAVPSAPHVDADPKNSDLLNIKQSALQQLSPLVGHLDQTPEEKFRTTMMMIQASDDQALIKDAYEAAQAISDEKVKAQALLDIVNEINYFTQHADHE